MNKQFKLDNLPPKTKPNTTAYQKRKWRKALNDYILEQANTVGQSNGWCLCGCMSFCDYCKDVRSCVAAVKERAREKKITIDYKNYDFEKLIKELEK